MGHLAADDTVDLGGLGLHLESLDVVGSRDEVELRRELESSGAIGVRGIKPVAREDGKLAIVGESLQALLDVGEVRSGHAVLLADVERVGDVCVNGVERVDIVKAVEVVEPQDVAVHELRHLREVADHTAALRGIDAESSLASHSSSMGVRDGANAADTLSNDGGILAGTVLKNELHAAEETRGDPRVLYLSILDFHVDAKVAFDTSYGVNG